MKITDPAQIYIPQAGQAGLSIFVFPQNCSVVQWLSNRQFRVLDGNLPDLMAAKRFVNALLLACKSS